MALPLFTEDAALGVLTLADRADLQPFTRSDLTVARALAAPASLALVSSRLADQAKELAHAAAVDPLTGLFNRRYFETRIDEEIQRARRYALDLALLVIDADDFKSLNDLLGHLVGDRVLRAMSDTLRRSVRAFDVCTRFGGEEFAILMPGSSAASALQSAERIRQRIDGYKFDPCSCRRTCTPPSASASPSSSPKTPPRTSLPARTGRSTSPRRRGRTAYGWRWTSRAVGSRQSAVVSSGSPQWLPPVRAPVRGPGSPGRMSHSAVSDRRESFRPMITSAKPL